MGSTAPGSVAGEQAPIKSAVVRLKAYQYVWRACVPGSGRGGGASVGPHPGFRWQWVGRPAGQRQALASVSTWPPSNLLLHSKGSLTDSSTQAYKAFYKRQYLFILTASHIRVSEAWATHPVLWVGCVGTGHERGRDRDRGWVPVFGVQTARFCHLPDGSCRAGTCAVQVLPWFHPPCILEAPMAACMPAATPSS